MNVRNDAFHFHSNQQHHNGNPVGVKTTVNIPGINKPVNIFTEVPKAGPMYTKFAQQRKF